MILKSCKLRKSVLVGAREANVVRRGRSTLRILEDLAFSGFQDNHEIDMGRIDVSKLGPKYLLPASDVRKPKATVEGSLVMSLVKDRTITPHYCAIQDKHKDCYNFHARRWRVENDNSELLKPTNRWVIGDTLTPKTAVPLCMLATIHRKLAHCDKWASIQAWPGVFEKKRSDNDDPEHVQWVYEQVLQRAQEFNVSAATGPQTHGVIKNIMEAILSTKAIITASCCNEALEIAAGGNPYLNNYMMYIGNGEKKDDCPVCGNMATEFTSNPAWSREEFMVRLKEEHKGNQIEEPTLQLKEQRKPNLEEKMKDLVGNREEIAITDPGLPCSLRLNIICS
ncbi:hypothetical protein HOY80DRAFT_1018520 [Tuber brumale]|nr:hypothetical protein HOY80DRAFT_1018520 [Tuber brumale]